jgi:hypothetical protein
MKMRVIVVYTTIYMMIDKFNKEQVFNEVKIEQYSNDGHKHKWTKKYIAP